MESSSFSHTSLKKNTCCIPRPSTTTPEGPSSKSVGSKFPEKSFSQHFALTPGLSPFGWGWKWIKDQVSEMGSLSYTSSLRKFHQNLGRKAQKCLFFREPQDICLILWMAVCTCTSMRIACYTNILRTVIHRNMTYTALDILSTHPFILHHCVVCFDYFCLVRSGCWTTSIALWLNMSLKISDQKICCAFWCNFLHLIYLYSHCYSI